MSETDLLTWQRQQIAGLLTESGLDFRAFRWGTEDATFAGWSDAASAASLVHVATGFRFAVALGEHPGTFVVLLSPTASIRVGTVRCDDWSDVVQAAQAWAFALRRELTAVDPWAELEAQTDLLMLPTPGAVKNDRFTQDERRQIAFLLDQWVLDIDATGHLTEPEVASVRDFAEKQKVATGRLGRIDWKNQFVGWLFGLATLTMLSAEARSTILHAADALMQRLAANVHLLH